MHSFIRVVWWYPRKKAEWSNLSLESFNWNELWKWHWQCGIQIKLIWTRQWTGKKYLHYVNVVSFCFAFVSRSLLYNEQWASFVYLCWSHVAWLPSLYTKHPVGVSSHVIPHDGTVAKFMHFGLLTDLLGPTFIDFGLLTGFLVPRFMDFGLLTGCLVAMFMDVGLLTDFLVAGFMDFGLLTGFLVGSWTLVYGLLTGFPVAMFMNFGLLTGFLLATFMDIGLLKVFLVPKTSSSDGILFMAARCRHILSYFFY